MSAYLCKLRTSSRICYRVFYQHFPVFNSRLVLIGLRFRWCIVNLSATCDQLGDLSAKSVLLAGLLFLLAAAKIIVAVANFLLLSCWVGCHNQLPML